MKPELAALLGSCGLCLFRDDFSLEAWRSREITAEMKSAYAASRYRITIENGIATMPINGPIISGGFPEWGEVEPAHISRDANILANDAAIKAVVVRIDSPGGTVSGTAQAGDSLAALSKAKKTVAIIENGAYSAAYWLAAQASKIYMSQPTDGAGSIGVRTMLVDSSKHYSDMGFTVHHITTGKYKAIGAPAKPISEEDIAYVQAEVNILFSAFVDAVARGRGLGKKVIRDMEARIYTGQNAVDAGLVDAIMPTAQVYAMIDKSVNKAPPSIMNSRASAALALAQAR